MIPTQFGGVMSVLGDPHQPQHLHLIASGKAGRKLLRSNNGGRKWLDVTALVALAPGWEPFSIAYAPTTVGLLYLAAIGKAGTQIHSSGDGGATWQLVGTSASFNFGSLIVSPTNSQLLFGGEVGCIASTNGGAAWTAPPLAGTPPHADVRQLCYQRATRGVNLYLATDVGVFMTPDHGATCVARNGGLVTAQFFSVAIDSRDPNRTFGCTQDNGSWTRPETGGPVWTQVLGGDGSIGCEEDPAAPAIAWISSFLGSTGGIVFRTANAGSAVAAFTNVDLVAPQAELVNAFPAMTLSGPPTTAYLGTYRLWTSVGGAAWQALPTTTTDGSKWSSALISCISVCKSVPSVILLAKIGSNFYSLDSVFRSIDGGQTWRRAQAGLPDAYIAGIAIDPDDPDVAYAALCHRTAETVFRTIDGGASWGRRGRGLPLGFHCHVVRFDPKGGLYAGTDIGVYRSTDDGAHWHRFGDLLPNCMAHDLRVLPNGPTRVATFGRGVWELVP